MKRENMNLLLAMIMVAGVMLLAFLCFRTGKALDSDLTGLSGSFQEATRDGEVEDVEGYALIVQAIAEMILLWRMISDGFTPVCVATEILLLGMTIYSAVNTYSVRMQEL